GPAPAGDAGRAPLGAGADLVRLLLRDRELLLPRAGSAGGRRSEARAPLPPGTGDASCRQREGALQEPWSGPGGPLPPLGTDAARSPDGRAERSRGRRRTAA